jgi:Tfp pilus assembly protein PilO
MAVVSMHECVAQTANEVVFSLGYALELEDRLREADALRAELRKVKAELAETKATAARGAGVRRRPR